MNIVFTAVLVVSLTVLLFVSPDLVLPTLISGSSDGVTFAVKLFAIYSIWLSVLNMWTKMNFSDYIGNKLRFILKRLFPNESKDCYTSLAINLSANLLGMGNAGTPAGIAATNQIKYKKNRIMLLVINSTSIQLIPTTIIAIRSTYFATTDIILPTLISTFISTFIGIVLVKIFVK